MAEFGFAYTLGNAIAQPVQNAVVQGFQIGVGLMTKPFEYFANRFGERVQDELSDLKAAGGFFSIAQRQEGEKFIKTFDQAVDFTQANNKILAKLAASLPGSTQDYIEVSKRISDSVARTVMTDKGAAVKYAEELRRKDTSTYGLQAIEGTGAGAQQRAIQVMLGEMTKKTVLAGQGGRAGAGGMMGAYGLPQLTERMLSQDEVSMGQFQRYSAIFSDPMIMDALAREIPNINKTAKNSVDRFKALQKLYDTVLPPELVARYRRTFAGIQETFNTAIFGPETGLFGLGRKMQGLGKKMNEFGEYVDKTGKVVSDASMAMDADLSIYDLFRDIIVNTGQILTPLVENFTLLWDPLQKIGLDLKRAREVTAEVLRSFHGYIKGWEDFEKNLSKDAKLLFQQGGGAPLRATLSTLSNLLAEVGAISDIDFAKYRDMMKDPSAKLGPILQEMVDKLLDSDIAKSIGEMIGTIVGTVLVEVSKVTGLISGRIEKSNKLVAGLQKGFKDAGGEQAFSNIFKDVFTAMFNVLKTIWNLIPWQGKLLAAAALVLPAVIQGMAMALASGITSALTAVKLMLASRTGPLREMVLSYIQRMLKYPTKIVPVNAREISAPITDPRRMLPPGKTPPALPSAALAKETAKAPGIFAKLFAGLKKFWKIITLPMKALGKLNIAVAALTGIIEFVTAIFTGSDLAEALGKTAGPVIGSIIGGALLGPLGAAIGGWIGSMKPVVDTFTGIFKGIGWALQNAWAAIGPSLEALGGIVQTLWNAFVGLIPGMDKATAGLDMLNFAFIAVKVALFPFVSILNGVAFALQLLKLGLLKFDLWVNKTFQWGDREGRLQAEINKTQREMEETALRQKRINEDLLKPLEDKTKKKTAAGAKPTPPRQIATPTAPKPATAQDIQKTFSDVAQLTAPKPGKLSTFEGMFDKKPASGKLSAFDGMFDKPQKPVAEVQQTAKNTFQLNQKAAQQVSAINATKNAASATKTATEATKNAVVAQKATLGTIQTTLSAMYGLLASGMLRVQTQMGMNGMLPGGFLPPGYIPPNLNPKKGQVSFPGIGESPKIGYQGHLGDAISQEMKHKPPGSDLVIANSSETIIPAKGLQVRSAWGGMNAAPMTVNTTVTINQQPGQDADALATIVAMKIGEAVADARASSLFV
jgi:hypothetical protein